MLTKSIAYGVVDEIMCCVRSGVGVLNDSNGMTRDAVENLRGCGA